MKALVVDVLTHASGIGVQDGDLHLRYAAQLQPLGRFENEHN